MLDRIIELLKSFGAHKLFLAAILGFSALVCVISLLSGKQDTPIAIMSEDIIEDVIEAETGLKLDINNNGK